MMRQLLAAGAAGLVALHAAVATTANREYDYIIVGSGPGGAPLAANLAMAGQSVLLLEAGDDQGSNPTYADIANFNAAGNDPLSRWDFFVRHFADEADNARYEKTTWRRPDGSFYVGLDPPAGSERLGVFYPRAATLGGCAMHNGGICALPADDDWNLIANLTGDDTWAADNMRRYFVKMEQNEYLPAGVPGHSYDGYVHTTISDPSFIEVDSDVQKLASALVDLTGGDVAGDVNALDPDRDQGTGVFGLAIHADRKGKRTGSNTLIRATLDNPAGYPLTVQLESLVTKVLFAKHTRVPTAIGVEYLKGKSLYKADPRYNASSKGDVGRAYAKKEVILSGGAFNSPQILKLSGIGPRKELRKFGIPVIKDLPGVGERMADNYEAGMLGLASKDLNGTAGPVAVLLRTPTARSENRNIHAWCGAFSFEGFYPGFPTDYGPSQYECAIVHMNPRSQAGYVRLASADPRDVPDINLRFFDDEEGADEDLTELLDAVKTFRRAMDSAGAPIAPFDEKHPCPGRNRECSDADQKDYIRLQAYSHHATSTCAIGPASDRYAVLDSKFRVHGVRNLRVVDASAFPTVPGAFPVCPTFMLGEKAADDILKELRQQV
ncbi:hypothetical protein DL766_001411 [Monosporascus sp. MC13-8B]|uniref:Glucose-methanol-choline oxidoreductase N-terminal domain-containing protein n=1 Tax=Monosporascus cannonballus TaxID=155416 RepID=A0ABY0HEJ3_9PEZI|nr:hypothetical protein DL762_002518 [Monosporascus cannonballus]RYO98861.1 hypothetical protein DL763_001904 [Monosporascus cannonballus]RYP37762.1 hypothetical protein DL766_001411 [Monosporascus sp. MC13-8B]